jgi:hypothetical protein
MQRKLRDLCESKPGVFRKAVQKEPAKFAADFEIEVDAEKWLALVSGRERVRTQSNEKMVETKRQIDELLDLGVIERSQEARFSQVTLAKKPNGKWRFCIDFRQLNEVLGEWPSAVQASHTLGRAVPGRKHGRRRSRHHPGFARRKDPHRPYIGSPTVLL